MIYRFSHFIFDSNLRELRRGRQLISIRPKTAQVLEYLLEHRQQVVNKQELLSAVWKHDFVEDHALFQLISEIRQLLADKRCITTFPNQGYRWAWPTQVGERFAWPTAPLLAGLATLVVLLGIGLLPSGLSRVPATPNQTTSLTASPAMGAVARAIELRAQGDPEKARSYLEMAVAANPQFAAAKLELAQTLRVLGDFEAAQRNAYEALSDARIIGDGYLEATAHVVLSQLRWLEGDLSGAIQLNSQAEKIADDRGYICAAQVSAAWRQQLMLATAKTGSTALPEMPESSLTACMDALTAPGDDASGMSLPNPMHPARHQARAVAA
jgi:tetratricopeptide (TPR) repeat protein